MPVRNEDWILGLSARVALMWCDRLVILNHASTDGTARIINELGAEYRGRIISLGHGRTEWDEMSDREWLLGFARANGGETGATHIALIDADEILTGNLISGIRQHIEELPLGVMMTLPLYNLRGGLNRYHLNGIWGQRTLSVAFKDVNTAAWKGNTFHRREPPSMSWHHRTPHPIRQGAGGVMHLWGCSERRLTAKHALYKVNEVLQHEPLEGAESWRAAIEFEYSQWRDGRPARGDTPDTWTYGEVPAEWWTYRDLPLAAHLPGEYLDCEPWQEAEVRRLVAEHGKERFAGLDLFGIA
jgi:hypothetical protein